MNKVQSFKGYGKVDEHQEAAFRQKSRRRCIIIVVSVIVLTAIVIGAIVGSLATKNRNDDDDSNGSTQTTSAESIKAVCSVTQYPESCVASLSSSLNGLKKLNSDQLIKLSMQIALQELDKLSDVPDTLISRTTDPFEKKALENCKYLFQDSVDQLNSSIASVDVGSVELLLSATKIDDVKTWISTAITNQETCLDGLDEPEKKNLLEEMKKVIQNSTEFTSNSLAIVSKIEKVLKNLNIPSHRKLLAVQSSDFPSWVYSGDRRLLQTDATKPIPDIIVAKDGTPGAYATISEAVKAVGLKNTTRTVIYVKEGKYVENVFIDKAHWNIMMIGDGMKKTIVSGSLNYIEGTPTFTTATFIVAGRGFICMDMGFENTAGPDKHQAVAMRSGSDQSVFYRCAFDAFQDTLYAHSNRQFYRDCEILGTIDFIFGNAAVVFQGCDIKPRKPMANQFITVTAQGKKDPNQNTGISIQRSKITPLDAFTSQIYLGRPWKDFSTTIIMETEIATINPKGWIEWIQNVDPPSTIFYGEYKNTGPGSVVSGRVNWTGYQPAVPPERALQYTVTSFIEGGVWLPQTKVTFDAL